MAEIDLVGGVWQWQRGYVYAGAQLLAVQQNGVYFVHEDPITKSKRVTDMSGVIQSSVETDPYGADTSRSSNAAFQPRKFTSYERDANGTDEAMFRRYNRWHSRFDQPDPYEGSYDMANPQSFNRYAYVQNDPVNFVDPTGLDGINEWVDVYDTYNPLLDPSYLRFLLASLELMQRPSGGGGGDVGGGGGGGGPQNPTPPDFVREFYDQYQKKLARCIWQVFGTDAYGNPSNGSAILPRQTIRNAPNIDMSRTEAQLNRVGRTTDAGLTRGPNGTIEMARDIRDFNQDGIVLSAREYQMRTYAHELGNLLAGRITGSVALGAETYGSGHPLLRSQPIRPPIVAPVTGEDWDAGARLESCIFGNMRP